MKLFISLFCLLLLATFSASQAYPADPLRLCLDDSAPPFSVYAGDTQGGFDVRLAQSIANRLGRDLSIQWFSTEDLPEAGEGTKVSVAALLADGRCDLAGSYPLLDDSVGDPFALHGRLPRTKGGNRADRARSVALSRLMPTIPFIYTAPIVVVGPSSTVTSIDSLSQLKDLRIGVEQSSLDDIILTLYQDGSLLSRLHHITPGGGLLERLEAGEYDAVLVDQHRFGGYRAAHPNTKLREAHARLPHGFNLGFLGLARNSNLILSVNAVIGELISDGTVERIAKEEGLTYIPPRNPALRPALSLSDLANSEALQKY